jgi:hypothetical protein
VGRGGCAGCPPTKQVTTGGYDTANSDEHGRQILRAICHAKSSAQCNTITNTDSNTNTYNKAYTCFTPSPYTITAPVAYADENKRHPSATELDP